MKKILFTSMAMFLTGLLKNWKQNPEPSVHATRLKMSLLYIKAIKTLRLLCMGLVGAGVCLVFLLVGLVAFNTSFFLYAPLDAQTKLYIGFLSAFFYCGVAAAIFYYVFLQNTWMSMFHAQEVVDELAQETKASSQNEEESEQESNNGHSQKESQASSSRL